MIDTVCRGTVIALGLALLWAVIGFLLVLGAALCKKALIEWVSNFKAIKTNATAYAVWRRVMKRYHPRPNG